MALGQELKEARMRMDLTASEVASATRMKVQIVEAIEDDDYSVFAAPIYGKGFIRLYAEYVGLDARPMVEEFTDSFTAGASPQPRPQMRAREKAPDPEPTPEPTPSAPQEDVRPEPAPEPRKPRRGSASARPGRQFDLFNDLPDEEPENVPSDDTPATLPEEIPADPPAAVAPEPDPDVLPMQPEPVADSAWEPDVDPESVVDEAEDVISDEPADLEPEPMAPAPLPPEPETDMSFAADVDAATPAADSVEDDYEDPQDVLSPSLRDRIEKLFLGTGENGEREGLQVPHLVIGGVGIIIILAFIISGISQCARGPADANDGSSPGLDGEMVLGIDMPEPYFD